MLKNFRKEAESIKSIADGVRHSVQPVSGHAAGPQIWMLLHQPVNLSQNWPFMVNTIASERLDKPNCSGHMNT